MSSRFLFRLLASSALPLLSIVFAATMTTAETPKTLHDFAVKSNDGSSAYSSLTLDAAGKRRFSTASKVAATMARTRTLRPFSILQETCTAQPSVADWPRSCARAVAE
jgi:hypothetical protein